MSETYVFPADDGPTVTFTSLCTPTSRVWHDERLYDETLIARKNGAIVLVEQSPRWLPTR